jgi:type IV secretory pathway TrbD component
MDEITKRELKGAIIMLLGVLAVVISEHWAANTFGLIMAFISLSYFSHLFK